MKAKPNKVSAAQLTITRKIATGPAYVKTFGCLGAMVRNMRHDSLAVQSLSAPRPAGWKSVWNISTAAIPISRTPTQVRNTAMH